MRIICGAKCPNGSKTGNLCANLVKKEGELCYRHKPVQHNQAVQDVFKALTKK